MTRVAITGASGRMGRTLIDLVLETEGVELGAVIDHSDSPLAGIDVGSAIGAGVKGVQIESALTKVVADFDVLIDFTRPEATLGYLKVCADAGKGIVIGTTGFDDAGIAAIKAAAEKTSVVFSPNMSVGVNLSYKLLELAARVMGDDSDIEIIEAHHRHKVDAPSGTALRMGEVVAAAMGKKLDDCAVYTREGNTGERQPGTIGFATIRAGDIVGEHTVMFAGQGERIEVTHKASSRETFAAGAIRAAKWIDRAKPGLFDMQDVLGLAD